MRIIVLLIVTFFYSQSIFALSSKDIGLYKSIFNDYRNGNFDKGDKDIAKLDDLILMGHVQALKLLHPTAHRSSFLELRDWLSEYSDHYEARRIYKLGVRRMPDGAKKPKKNSYPLFDEIFQKDKSQETVSTKSNKIFSNKNYSKKISIYNTVRSRVGRGWPTGALEYLNHHIKYFNQKEKSFLLSKIANGYYLADLDDKAINVLNDEAFLSQPYDEGLWIKGLSYYRKGKYQKASRQFLILSKISDNKWLRDAGAYWSFLSSTKDANDEITFKASLEALNKSCKPSFNIYSILSCRILDKTIQDFEFNTSLMSSDLESFLNTKLGERIQALIEIDELPIAEIELNRLQNITNERFKRLILNFSIKNGLSSLQIKTAKYLFKDGLMQILPSTARMVNKKHKFKSNPRILYDPEINVETGSLYLQNLLSINYINGDLLKALISYNAGPGNLSKWMKKTTFNDDSFLLIESIPSRETRMFVERVLTNLVIYELINHNSFNYADELIATNTILIND